MATDKQLYEAHREGWTYAQIAERFDQTESGVRGRVGRYVRKYILDGEPDSTPFPIMVGSGQRRHQLVPRYASMPIIYGDMDVGGDYHMPTGDWAMIELKIRFGEKHLPKGNRRSGLLGDLVNFDLLSQYDHLIKPYSNEDELAFAEGLLEFMFSVYDEIYFELGNHDHRFLKQLGGDFGTTRLGRMFSRQIDTGRLIFTRKSQMIVVSAGQVWRLTHQRAYSRTKGVVANKLAQKHLSNMVTHHEHHVNISRDEWNRFTTVNNGMLGDYEKMPYVMLVDSPSAVMCTSFTFIRKGTAHLLTPYPTLTDWSMWGMENQALKAIESAKAKMERLTMPEQELPDLQIVPLGVQQPARAIAGAA